MSKVTIMSFYENWVEVMDMCTPEEWYQLCKLMTDLRFNGKDTNPKDITNQKIKMAWGLIRPSIKKSNRNYRYNNKSALQEVKETEFDIPKTEDNAESENKADLSPSKPSVDAEYHQQVETPSNGLKTGKEEVLEEDIINILNDSNIMSNPTNIRLDKETGKYYTDEKVKEIREKVEKSNNKPLPVVEDNMPTWEKYFSDYKYIIKDIIECYNSGTSIAKTHQIPENFKTLFNNKAGQYYKDRVLKIIEHYTNQQIVA